jgi:hypothetical protein
VGCDNYSANPRSLGPFRWGVLAAARSFFIKPALLFVLVQCPPLLSCCACSVHPPQPARPPLGQRRIQGGPRHFCSVNVPDGLARRSAIGEGARGRRRIYAGWPVFPSPGMIHNRLHDGETTAPSQTGARRRRSSCCVDARIHTALGYHQRPLSPSYQSRQGSGPDKSTSVCVCAYSTV